MHKQVGYSLIEVLVSLLIVSILMSGMIAVQFIAERDTKTAYYLSVAKNQLSNMVERLKTNESSNSDDYLNETIRMWNIQNQSVLPKGRGTLFQDGQKLVLSLFWDDDKNTNVCQQNKIGLSGCLRLAIQK